MYAMRQLGHKGRFANQLLQYAHLRIRSQGDYQCPAWIGQLLFGHQDPPCTHGAPDIGHQFPHHTSYYMAHQALFRSLFQPVPDVLSRVHPLIEMLRNQGHHLVGLHLRRGDYGTFRRKSARWCYVAPTDWYLDWLSIHFSSLKSPILVIASDEPDKVLNDFRSYNVVVPDRTIPEAPYYSDFYALTQCDTVLISNSTFGFVASMLNDRTIDFYRPHLSKQMLLPYNPWNAEVVLKHG